MKKMTAMLLTLALVLSMSLVPAAFAEAEPITIQFWHHRGSGTQYECVTHAVEGFNSTVGQELGIVVEEAYIGDYVQLFSQIQLAVQSGDAPNVVSAANTYTAYMLEDGLLVDMVPLAEEDDYDITGNLMDWLLEIGGNTDGQIHSLPYCRSTPLFYYNKAVAEELGIEIGEMITIDELVAFGEAAMKTDENGNVTRYGFEIFNDFGYYNAAWIYQLGSEYMAEGGGCPALEDGTMLKILTDWRDWVDAGWCRVYDATNAGDIAQTMLISGELASFMNSCAGLGNMMVAAEESGVEVGVAMFPTYDPDNHIAEIGGANIAILGADNSDEEIEASWEFVKYLMSDEEQFFNAKTSGYVACTKSIASYEPMVEYWEENPEFKVAYDQMLNYGRAQETPYVAVGQDFTQICWDTVSLLIAEQSITPEEAVEMIATESEDIW